MDRPVDISVVVPAYNEEQLIGRSLSSLSQQQFSGVYEIIVVDNNCTDQTAAIAKSFGAKIVPETRQGVVFARQKGLISAKGEIVVGADADCVYPRHWLQTMYDHFRNDTRVVAVGGPGTGNERQPYWGYLSYSLGNRVVHLLYKLTGKVIYLLASNFAFKREVFLGLGGYRTYLPLGTGDEWDPLWRLQRVGKVVYDPRLLTTLSLRRYRVGFIKFWLVHCFYYYILGGIVAQIFKRPIIQAAPVRNV